MVVVEVRWHPRIYLGIEVEEDSEDVQLEKQNSDGKAIDCSSGRALQTA